MYFLFVQLSCITLIFYYFCGMINTKEIFEKQGIRSTTCRIDLVNYFTKNKFAISFPQLEKALKKHDRTSVYRNLIFFEEQGVVHKLYDADGILKYALCKDNCAEHLHHDNHMHLTCNKCKHTYCLNEKHTPKIKSPKKVVIKSVAITARGLCENCKN